MNYKRIYDSIIERAKERVPEGYVERHHIIPRCLGGSDDKHNLVALTPEEHFLCHVLLVKIYPEHTGLIYAVNMMCNANGKTGRKSRKLYGWLKRKFSTQRKIDGKGSGNTQHNTIWINKVGTLKNKKIHISEQIPDGWVKGRKLTEKSSKIVSCFGCGMKECKTEFECSKIQLAARSLKKFFGFDMKTKGTEDFPLEVKRVKLLLTNLYHEKKMSIEDIRKKFNVSTNETVRKVFVALCIERRDFISAAIAYKQKP